MRRLITTAVLIMILTGWVGSYRWGGAAYRGEHGVIINRGVAMSWFRPGDRTEGLVRFDADDEPIDTDYLARELPVRFSFRLAGFAFGRFDTRTGRDTIVIVPFWFPAALAAWATWRAWRKRRGTARGFEVSISQEPPPPGSPSR